MNWNFNVEEKPFKELYTSEGIPIQTEGIAVYVPEEHRAIEHNSPTFTLISNEDLVLGVNEVMGIPKREIHYISNDKLCYTGALRYGALKVRDEFVPEVIIQNSYTERKFIRSITFSIIMLICENGMVAPSVLSTVHIRSFDDFDRIQLGADKLVNIYEQIIAMKDIVISSELLESINQTLEQVNTLNSLQKVSEGLMLSIATEKCKNLFDLYMEYTRYVSHNERANWRTRFKQTAALSFFFNFVAEAA